MKSIRYFFLAATTCLFIACGSNKNPKADKHNVLTAAYDIKTDSIVRFDVKQDVSHRSLQELRLLKNLLYAKQGFCFMQADLRGYFAAHMQGYDSLMNARFESEEDGNTKFPPIAFTSEEADFIKRIEVRETQLRSRNYTDHNGIQLANVDNVINLFQFNRLPAAFMQLLQQNNFAIVPANKIQLFHIYEENDYHQIPSFVTTDMYLQLYHMYFSYIMRSLEEQKFSSAIVDLSEGCYQEATNVAATTADEQIKRIAEYTAAFYAIPYFILTGKKKTVAKAYSTQIEDELKKIDAAKDAPSVFLDQQEAYFGYSLFKPRGHYTRSDQLQKFFKAMMWLQTAPFCRNVPEQLKRATFMACMLDKQTKAGSNSLKNLYNAVYEPIVFLVGQPDNLSVNDICDFIHGNNLSEYGIALAQTGQSRIDMYLQETSKHRNRIKPKIEISCRDKINLMPQRYLFDNEILLELVDTVPNAERAYPKGLDVFAAMGNTTAEYILKNDYKDNIVWPQYDKKLEVLKRKFATEGYGGKTVYNKWMQLLQKMQEIESSYPSFMKTGQWAKKNLNTALASWTDLKHDAILYGEQPAGAECGGGGPPDPITVGYVEPNVNFWKAMAELLELTNTVLKNNGLLTEDISAKTKQIYETTTLLLSASEKELRHQKLSEQEYKAIEIIGASTEYLSLSIVEPDKGLQHWEDVKGADRSVAVVADVYTRNIPDCGKNGILHEAVGCVNELYVVVEIEGNLYLTKGATFSYYEFVMPAQRLTDEEWQKMLESKKDVPKLPKWMNEIILQTDSIPTSDEKVFYSSGC